MHFERRNLGAKRCFDLLSMFFLETCLHEDRLRILHKQHLEDPPPRQKDNLYGSVGAANGSCFLNARKTTNVELWQCHHIIFLFVVGIVREQNIIFVSLFDLILVNVIYGVLGNVKMHNPTFLRTCSAQFRSLACSCSTCSAFL